MKIITITLWISLLAYQIGTAQYDDPPAPILIEEEEEKEIFIGTLIKPRSPYFSCCEEDSSTYNAKKSCSDQKLLHYIYSTLNYPDSAKANQKEGMVILSFLIKKDGWIDPKSIKVLRDIGYGCGAEAFRIVHSFNEELGQWSFDGKSVDVRYNLPIRFRLN